MIKNHRTLLAIGLAFVLWAASGCNREQQISTEYGKTAGMSAGKSVNGVSVLKKICQSRGMNVDRTTRISPRMDEYQTVFWFPDRSGYPSQEAVTAIEDWLESGYQRTFVYVGRGYNAELQYWESVVGQVEGPQHELARRKLARSRMASDTQSQFHDYYLSETECDWYKKVETPRVKAKRLTGPWASGVVDRKANVQMGDLLESKLKDEGYPDYKSMLKGDSQTLAFRHAYGENQLIVISNGSFLLNYGLVNKENRKLADKVIDEFDNWNDSVLFLESGPGPIQVRDSDAPPAHNQWAWMNTAPLKYIVPQFFLWGVVFCFVYFPIFGRPRTIPRRVANFRNHIDAFGRLLTRTKKPGAARNMIDQYNSISGESNKKKRE